MKVVIPMAGMGDRFIRAGYKDPKPLIMVNGKRIIEYILEMFSDNDEIFFICNDFHLQNTDMESILRSLRPQSEIISIAPHKKGPIHTVLLAGDFLTDDDEVMICYCDNPYLWNHQDFLDHIRINNLEGCILTHSGFHPHTLSSTKMAFLKVDNELLLQIKEKECYTDDPMSEHASTGAYYFRRGSYIKKYFPQMIDRNIHYNGEYYVTLSYNLLVEDGLRVGFYDTDYVTVFGTPDEVENFEAWATILNGSQVKSVEELVKCYTYWKDYYEINKNL